MNKITGGTGAEGVIKDLHIPMVHLSNESDF